MTRAGVAVVWRWGLAIALLLALLVPSVARAQARPVQTRDVLF
jgi:hypothetical protein